jgi:hypothetical protein
MAISAADIARKDTDPTAAMHGNVLTVFTQYTKALAAKLRHG